MSRMMLLAVLKPDSRPLPELPCGPARLLESSSLGAVVFVPPEPGLLDQARDTLARRLLAHQQSLEILEPHRMILPAAFGAEFRSEADGLAFLDANATRLGELLASHGSKREFRITIACPEADQSSLATRLLETTEAGSAGLNAREILRMHFRTTIAEACVDTLELPTDSPETILNLVALIDMGSEARLDAALCQIDALASDRLRIRSAGPLPACSFASLTSDAVSEARIDTACAALGLVRPVGQAGPEMAAVRHAFARKARSAHPDAGGNPSAFDVIRQSFALLRSLGRQDRNAGFRAPSPLLRVVRADQHEVT